MSVTAVDSRSDMAGGWTSEGTDSIYGLDEPSGTITFLSPMGLAREQVRVTHTGGYWTVSTPYPTLPTGATALPGDLMLAFKEQCLTAWRNLDKIGTSILSERRPEASYLYSTELEKGVESILKQYRRQLIL